MSTTDALFIAHVGDPYSIAPLVLVGCGERGEALELSVEQLSDERRLIVSYDLRTLIDALRFKSLKLPETAIDIGDALRLRSGLSRTQGGEKQWTFWSFVSPELLSPEDLAQMRRLVDSRELHPDRDALLRLLGSTSLALRQIWQELRGELERNGEFERFVEIEIPVRQIFSMRQYLGLNLDREASASLISEASNMKYAAFRELAAVLGFSPSGLTFHNVGKYLDKTDAARLSEYGESDQLEEYFKLAQESSRFADAFLGYIRANRALSVLRAINYSESRVYPAFDCFGTVSGRILVTDPRLQQLPKRFRHVLAPDEGMSLWYFDYSQFEPGVLAHLAGDIDFRKFYQSADVYESLSTAVFGNRNQRDLCKSIFLAYCYGMSTERIAALLADRKGNSEGGLYESSIVQFFDALPGLSRFKEQMQSALARDGYIASLFGNKRYRTSSGPLGNAEKRWALNQVVQGTASLIFKQAVLEVASEFGPESILLPMHDAILMQFDRGADVRIEVEKAMVKAFRRWCPSVMPRITTGAFAITVPRTT